MSIELLFGIRNVADSGINRDLIVAYNNPSLPFLLGAGRH